jgi:hypothetical protein
MERRREACQYSAKEDSYSSAGKAEGRIHVLNKPEAQF